MFFAVLTLLSALSVAGVAGWFSIVGVVSIYAGAPLHAALVMGIVLEGAKLVTISWLYRNWKFVGWKLKLPLIYFMITLMIATSIGVFGFLTKAHLEQGAATIDNSAKIERLDQQIAREKSIIADNEKVIAQLDTAINAYLGNDKTDRALAIRRAQAPQRKQLRDDIAAAQKLVDQYSEERLKLTSEIRSLELEVGPIRYIADLFYGSGGNDNVKIEAAVRIFTLLIVSTLDPLAVILLIAANHTILRLQNEKKAKAAEEKELIKNTVTTRTNINTERSEESKEAIQEITVRSEDNVEVLRKNASKDEAAPMDEPIPTAENINIKEQVDADEKEAAILEKFQPTVLLSPVSVISSPSISRVGNVVPGEIQQEITDAGTAQEAESTTAENKTVQVIEEQPASGTLTDSEISKAALEAVFKDRPDYFAPQEQLIEELIKEEIKEKIKKPRKPRKKKETIPVIAETKEEINIVEEPVKLAESKPTGPSAHQADALREITGISPHFVPQKLNEEAKKPEAPKAPNYYAPDIPKTITETIAEVFTVKQEEDKAPSNSKDANEDTTRDIAQSDDNNTKYPKALSWIKEFKGD